MTLYKWSRMPESNATADSTINWQEGQAPSSINDSARSMMVAMAKYRDDTTGAIATGGTSTAYSVTTYEAFDSLARLNGQIVAFTPHTTNGATVTLNVDGLGAKPLRSAPSTELLAGTLIQGTPYVAVYNHADQVFYLHGFYGNAYNIPLGGAMIYFGATAPNSSFVFPYGQSISRAVYAGLFSLFGTTYGNGVGDGLTFSLPDLRGRVCAGKDDMGGAAPTPPRLTSAYFGSITGQSGTTLGAVGGSESATLTLAQLPSGITSTGSNLIGVTSTVGNVIQGTIQSSPNTGGPLNQLSGASSSSITSTGSNTITVTSTNTAGAAHRTVQPTIICNYILRVL